jgi:sarcosine oxidase
VKIIIVGAGIAGLSTAWSLTKRGHQVTVLEQGPIPNPQAASGDHHRIIRRAYSAASGYGPMITEAFEAWNELWRDLGATHYDARGFAVFSQKPGDEADGFRDGLEQGGFAFSLLDEPEWQARFPFVERGVMRWGLVSPEGGALHSRRIALGLKDWLQAHGADLREYARVIGIDDAAGEVHLQSGESHKGDAIVVAAGAWTVKLLPQLQDRLTANRTAVVYVDPPAKTAAAWAAAPVILDLGSDIGGYVIPPSGGAGLKFGTERHMLRAAGQDADANRTPRDGEGTEILSHFTGVIRDLASYSPRDVVTCAYTFTHDQKFTAEAFGKVLVVSACSGHGYKFGAAVGRRAALAVASGDVAAFQAWLAPNGSVAA